MKKHKLTLMGGAHETLRIPAGVLRESVGALLEGARLATRFAVEGESVRKGTRPTWLEAACAVEITGLAAGSAVISMEAPTLQEADAVKFGRQPVDDDFGDQTAVDLFGRVLASVIEQDPDDVSADRALLETCARFARVSGSRFDGVRLDGVCGRTRPLVITRQHVPIIERLRDETPGPQGVRVAGILDTISASSSNITLALEDGTKVPARLEQGDHSTLQTLFGKPVVVSGVVHYRPSGKVGLIDVEFIEAAGPGDRVFAVLPTANRARVVVPAVPQDENSGVAAFFGTWPGEESDDELLDALQALG